MYSLHVKPNIPTIPGIENFHGEAYHSSQDKSPRQLVGKNILILGCGETAMDIAYESIKADALIVTMCFRTGFLSFPKVLNQFQVFGKTFDGSLPLDGLITNLFETAYVHHAVAKSRLRWFVSDAVFEMLDLAPHGDTSKLQPVRQRASRRPTLARLRLP